MSTHSARRRRHRLSTAVILTAGLMLAACGESTVTAKPADTDSPQQVDDIEEYPQECLDASILPLGPPNLSALELVPGGWPDAPAGSTLCSTSSSIDATTEKAQYASDLPREDVLVAYEKALTGFDVARDVDGVGADVLTGTADGIGFQVGARDGAITVLFARS